MTDNPRSAGDSVQRFQMITTHLSLKELPDKVSCVRSEVGREVELALKDLLDRLLPVLGGEGRCASQHIVHQGPKGPPVNGSEGMKKHPEVLVIICSSGVQYLPCPDLVRISGAMYSMVPQKVWVTLCSSIDSLQRPKSVSLTWPLASRRMFSGFKSLNKQIKRHVHTTRAKGSLQKVLGSPVNDPLSVQVLERQSDLCDVEAGRVLQEDALSLEVHEQLPAREILKNEVELALGLESVDEVDDEGVLHLLQDVPLGLGVSGVLLVADDGGFLQHLHGKDAALILAC